VIVTEHEIIVGLSRRSNQAGVAVMARVFAPTPVVAVSLMRGLHLKCVVTQLQGDTLVVADDEYAIETSRQSPLADRAVG